MYALRHVFRQAAVLPRTRFIATTVPRRKDPWPLPHTPEHLAATTTPPDIPPPEPLARPGESVDAMRARLVYQSRKRGTLESDLLLSTFAREQLPTMSEAELHEFDKVCLLNFSYAIECLCRP